MHYTIMQKISQNHKYSKLVNLYDYLPFIFECFMTYNMPSSTKKQHISTKPESHQMAKIATAAAKKVT